MAEQKSQDAGEPDLTDAVVYREAGRSITGGTWHVLPDGVVWFRQPYGRFQPAVVSAAQLASDAAWERVEDPAVGGAVERTGGTA